MGNPFNYSMVLSTMCSYFCKSDHGNLIGRQATRCGNRTARGGRRCRSDARVAPRSFVPVIPLLCLLFHGRAEVSFLNYKNDARLFVIREAAGEISRRSTASSEPAPFLRSSALLTMSWQTYEHTAALHSSRIHPEEHANDFIITSASQADRLARALAPTRSLALVRVPFIP